ncbi:hypothetical protein BVI2075_990012 [Burkholderia vietnamiensis]|nr:hypothetical protein BVI2075_990012 [Burkholderia vietnamiensis]
MEHTPCASQRCADRPESNQAIGEALQGCHVLKSGAIHRLICQADIRRRSHTSQWQSRNQSFTLPSGNPATCCAEGWTRASTRTMCWSCCSSSTSATSTRVRSTPRSPFPKALASPTWLP